MTPEDIKRIKTVKALPTQVRTAFYATLKAAEEKAREAQKECDHQTPTGTSAWRGEYCGICGLAYKRYF